MASTNFPAASDGSAVEFGSAVDPTSGKTYYFSIRASALRSAAQRTTSCAPALRFCGSAAGRICAHISIRRATLPSPPPPLRARADTKETFWEKPQGKVVHHGTYVKQDRSASTGAGVSGAGRRERKSTPDVVGKASKKKKAAKASASSEKKKKKRNVAAVPQATKKRRKSDAPAASRAKASASPAPARRKSKKGGSPKKSGESDDWLVSEKRYVAANNDQPKSIAAAHDVDVNDLLFVNSDRFPEAKAGSKLKKGTVLVLPFRVYNALDNETPRAIAYKLGVSAEEIVDLNAHRHRGLKATSKLQAQTDLVVNPRGKKTGRTVVAAYAMGVVKPPKKTKKK